MNLDEKQIQNEMEDLYDYCSICLELLNDKDQIKTTKCKHSYHKNCLKVMNEYYSKKNIISKCPMCNMIIENQNKYEIEMNEFKPLTIQEFIDLINDMIDNYDEYNLNQNPEIILSNIMEYFNGKKNDNFPLEIFFKLLVFDRIEKYSFFSYNYWFSKKTYKYQLVKILNNNHRWIIINSNKKYYDIFLDDNDTIIIDNIDNIDYNIL